MRESRTGAGGTAYSASKAGVVSLAQTMANQLAGTNIRVNAICPGLIETGMTKPMFEFADARKSRGKIGQVWRTRTARARRRTRHSTQYSMHNYSGAIIERRLIRDVTRAAAEPDAALRGAG